MIVVDYGVGNLSSVCNMLRKVGAEVSVSSDAEEILAADKLVLPGVGHFDHGMNRLDASRLRGVLERYALELRRPVLGICLGAQILGRGSEEGTAAGLGWIDMHCLRLPALPGLRVPHMGWAPVSQRRPCPLLDGAAADARYYFVHSYYLDCADQSDVVGTSEHGIEFASVVQRGHIFGTQFHPEKSLRHGMAVMRAFSEYCPDE
ncbi:imidazole glycerol phosphate synthase subunit HisH [Accumulibacter sp.]|uniref:imidazole glycerol phosphate synthase subunit HisH n=1 Tax=Accumulibacter sp. TaxID=2053492 RepID=UPI0025ED7547|nr:imidazole glycerol phosphate synthase subunit HisH [Accumulibacter sp.]